MANPPFPFEAAHIPLPMPKSCIDTEPHPHLLNSSLGGPRFTGLERAFHFEDTAA